MKELGIRTLVAIGLLGVLALMLIFGGWIQVAVFTFASVCAVVEMRRMFKKKDVRVSFTPLLAVGAVQTGLLYLAWEALIPEYVLPIVYLAAFLWIMTERILDKSRKTEDLIASVFMLIYPLFLILCFGFFGFGRNDVSRVALLLVFAGPCMADNNAYLFGSKFGKHKLCPEISPKKSVEGYIAGLVGGPVGGLIVYFIQKLWGLDVHWLWLTGLGLLGAFVGQFGDLLASTFKRWSGIKDYGRVFPGHGGVMDRIDSAMVFAPIVALIFWYFIR